MPIEMKIKCGEHVHRVAFSLENNRGKAEMLDHPSREMMAGFAVFGAKPPKCFEVVELIEADPAEFTLEHLDHFLRHMTTVKGRMAFFMVDTPQQANDKLGKFLGALLSEWIQQGKTGEIEAAKRIGEFLEESPETASNTGNHHDDVEALLTPLFTDAVGIALNHDDHSAIDELTDVTTNIDYSFHWDDRWPEEVDDVTRRVEATVYLEVGGFGEEWQICVEGTYEDVDFSDWELDDCGSESPPYTAETFLNAVGESYDPIDLVEIEEIDVPMDDGEGELSVWDGDTCLGIFTSYDDAERFSKMAETVASKSHSSHNIELRQLTDEAREKYEDDGELDDWDDPDNWE
jgi:hypothetical protein